MLAIYTVAMFVSAILVFLVQPMFARMVLPLLGGSPSVWNTAVVFYQAVLLAGYGYAHLTTAWLGLRRQMLLHGVIILLPLALLPIAIPEGWTPPVATSPIPWLLAVLAVAVGLPYFVVTTSSPLLQNWFSQTGHRTAHDPYFLYAASNVGSILGLLVYPFVLEPSLHLSEQSWLWTILYGVYVVLIGACGWIVWDRTRQHHITPVVSPSVAAEDSASRAMAITWWRRARWVFWAMAPSSLMLSVTTYMSTNIAAMPLLWVIPLVLYLLTFVMVFSRKPPIPHTIAVRALPIVLLPLLMTILLQATGPMELLIPLHLIGFFVVTLACHGALAHDRPPARNLTEFYLWLSFGGVLGGAFHTLLAPLIFEQVWEYPLMLIVVTFFNLLAVPIESSSQQQRNDILFPFALGGAMAILALIIQELGVKSTYIQYGVIFGVPMLISFGFSRRPMRFGLSVAIIFLVGTFIYHQGADSVIFRERSFFGVHQVRLTDDGQYHTLVHGTTIHGMQSLDPLRRREPLTYYYETGPLGQIFADVRGDEAWNVAAIGLGVGSVACYRHEGETWTFYEIDPSVERIALNPDLFTFLHDCDPDATIVLGDARQSLVGALPDEYDLMIMDAYSSDSIPIHLLTREAFVLYLEKLAPGGVIAFHISNRYLDLEPVLARLCTDAGVICRTREDTMLRADQHALGKRASQWVIIVRDVDDMGTLADDSRWQPLEERANVPLWTDDFASLIPVLRW